MARLHGAQRLVMQAIPDTPAGTSAFVEDARIARSTGIPLGDLRDWLLTLDH
jgi:hypothetical protein